LAPASLRPAIPAVRALAPLALLAAVALWLAGVALRDVYLFDTLTGRVGLRDTAATVVSNLTSFTSPYYTVSLESEGAVRRLQRWRRTSAGPDRRVEVERVAASAGPGADVLVYRPTRPAPPPPGGSVPLVLFVHGGSFAFGSGEYPMARDLAADLGVPVVSVDVSPAPQSKCPTQVNEVLGVRRWLAEEGVAKRVTGRTGNLDVVLMGDDTGGTIAASVAQASARDPRTRFSMQVLVAPVLRAAGATEAYLRAPRALPETAWMWRAYVDATVPGAAACEPGLGEVPRASPKALIVTGSRDVFAEEARQYADRLDAAARGQGQLKVTRVTAHATHAGVLWRRDNGDRWWRAVIQALQSHFGVPRG